VGRGARQCVEAKQKIDRPARGGKKKGFNIKLGRGGIREIEFIAQGGCKSPMADAIRVAVRAHLITLGGWPNVGLITRARSTPTLRCLPFLARFSNTACKWNTGYRTHSLPVERERRLLPPGVMNFFGGNGSLILRCVVGRPHAER